MITITIDNKKIEIEEGTSILEAALNNGIYIPHLCHHPDLPELGACKLCIVEIEGKMGIHTSCSMKAEDGMVIHTRSKEIDHLRSLAMELILAAHPEHCTSCPKYGRCEMQLLIQYMDATGTRMHNRVKKFPTNENPLILHDMLRCVLCGRCVRACKDLRGVGVLQYNKNNMETYVGTLHNKLLTETDCRFCGACAEVCPTGAIRDVLNFNATEKSKVLLPCVDGCPAHTDIPTYLRYAKEGEFAKANAVIHEKLLFPESLGRVCTHKCELNCRHKELNDAISIREVKRVCAEKDTEYIWKQNGKQLPNTGKNVAVIGGGPAGLTAAVYLRKQGHMVVVFEKEEKLGGQMQYGIPAYRLPREVVDRECDYAKEIGVEIRCNEAVTDFASLKAQYDAVVVATGTHKGNRLPMEGNELNGVTVCTEFLKKASKEEDTGIGKRIFVLGGGNVAFDCARTAKRLGAEKVYLACLEARENMLADEVEITEAIDEGIEVMPGRSFVSIEGDNKVSGMRISKIKTFSFDEAGRASIELEENSEEVIETDTVIFAVGQGTGLTDSCGLSLSAKNTITVKENSNRSSVDGIFACGDVVTGTKSVIEAIVAGRNTASEVDVFLGGNGDVTEVLLERDTPSAKLGTVEGFCKLQRENPQILDVDKRSSCFAEVSSGIGEQACAEASRCLQCDLRFQIQASRSWTHYQDNGQEDKE